MTTHITFREASDFGASSALSVPRASQTMTESGTSAQSTITAKQGEVCHIEATASIFVNYGSNPTAASGSGDMIQGGTSLDVGPLNAGDKIAIITIA